MWRCSVCGYVHLGEEAPETCPKCGAVKEKFNEVEEDIKKLIERSRFTNLLLARLYALMDEAQDIAAKGIEDNLDPACFHIFTYLQRESTILQQMVKAEIATHISKNKWG